MKKIVFCGGGTAGHIYPNLAIAENLKDYEIHYIGTNGMEKEIVAKYPNIVFHEITAVKFDRSKLFKNFKIPFKLFKSVKSAKKLLKEIKPNIVFSKGGFVSLPVAIAAKKLKLPLITHESDLSMGLANKIISKLALCTCTTFYQTSKKGKNFLHTGQPIRNSLFEGDGEKIKIKLGFPSKPILLFVGGSLGAKKINDLLVDPSFLTENFVVIHGVGKSNIENFKPQNNYHPIAYLDPIADYYMCADLVITRAGSGVINELLALQKPMLMLPLSKQASRGDQIENAKLFTSIGYGEMILDEDLTKENLEKTINKMLKNLDFYKKNMKKTGKNEANKKIIDLIQKFS